MRYPSAVSHHISRCSLQFRYRAQERSIAAMTLKQSNPHLKSAAARKAALRISAQTSSAIEGIRWT